MKVRLLRPYRGYARNAVRSYKPDVAKLLIRAGIAERVMDPLPLPATVTVVTKPEPAKPKPKGRKKGKYNRRDLRA